VNRIGVLAGRLCQPAFRHPAHHRIGRIEHVGDLVADGLTEDVARRGAVETKVGGKPIEHLRRGVLQRLIKRPRIAHGKNLLTIVAARPADPPALQNLHGKRDLERRLDAGADNLAVALAGMAIAEIEQRALRRYRKIDGNARTKPR